MSHAMCTLKGRARVELPKSFGAQKIVSEPQILYAKLFTLLEVVLLCLSCDRAVYFPQLNQENISISFSFLGAHS